MKREPAYSPQAADALDRLEASGDVNLYNAVCDAIDLICDHGDTAEARHEQVRGVSGTRLWKIAVRTRADDWVVLWWPVKREARILYIGEL